MIDFNEKTVRFDIVGRCFVPDHICGRRKAAGGEAWS